MKTTRISFKSVQRSIKKRATLVQEPFARVFSMFAICISLVSANVYAENHAAGVVSMTIGKAYLNNDTLIKVGTELNEGDKIETLSNGHVYIRFVDNGLVSIRPDSKLLIEHYQYNPDAPSDSVIKFDLTEGVMRSISGTGAKAARDKFRLNTPIAAIGVRGTDFVVKASSSLIQAVVNEGAIVVAPFSDACAAEALGPCSENSVELTGQAKQLLEISALASSPRLIPLSETFAAELKNSLTEESSDADSSEASNADESTEDQEATNSDEEVSDEPTPSTTNQKSSLLKSDVSAASNISSDNSLASVNTNTTNSSVDKDLKNTSEDRSEIESLVSAYVSDSSLATADNRIIPDNYVPESVVDSDSLSDRKLTWGRWGNALTTDRIVTTADVARFGKEIALTTVDPESGDISMLYRAPSGFNELDPTLAGSMSFNLVDAQATLTTLEGESSLMEVTSGTLDIDFSQGTFGTTLVTNHDLLSSDLTLSAEGSIDSNGILKSTSSDGYLKGATTLEGDAASYILHKDIDLGSVDAAAYFDR
ncbi:FecR family protein [Marinomonas ostreistagni]|uniref:FecR domain-containing protein n=1 Tax=Marinomonas ostreistagni TaxID=359209 RepID=A0ABS0ZCU5_9GAMM|nr:FecR family protein [Marinomonas ostreistagni]MBJ7551492.1 FecR domain-containing protein [Marinomonas ostreistagni]